MRNAIFAKTDRRASIHAGGGGGADSRIRTDDQRFTKPLTFTANQQLKT